jgi:Na+-driven multidrug efflux pump
MVNAQDTLVSQAFGAKETQVMQAVLCRSILTCMVVCLPLVLLFLFGGPVFRLIVTEQDADVADLAAEYIRLLIPVLFLFKYFVHCLHTW